MSQAEVWGIQTRFLDVSKTWRTASEETVGAVLDAMGAGEGSPPVPTMLTIRLDRPVPKVPTGRLVLEDGSEIDVGGPLPPDLPPGYHQLCLDDSPPRALVASPGRVPLPDHESWGLAAQLYAVRSQRSWGFGDFGDLRRLAGWSASLGAGFVIFNPLHACSPAYPQQASPYFAGSRSFVNPLYLAIEDVPGAATNPLIAKTGAAGRALNDDRLIDRDSVWRTKSAALELLFSGFDGDPRFDAFRAGGGVPLERFATYCALAETYGSNWREWPAEYRDADGAAVARFSRSRPGSNRVRFHIWLQWLLDRQLESAAGGAGIVPDLGVGVDPGGADTWIWPDSFARGVNVGAPPDRFATQGQDWALAPFDPWKLRSTGYQAWIHALRSVFRHASGLRVDHVMGLFRIYWIPEGFSAAEGAYVRYPHEDLLNILALEAHRAGAFVVGEDLGTVEDEVRTNLHERQVLSYRLWWFEGDRPANWPRQALGAVTTHDLPTIAGVLSGSDLEAQRRLGTHPNEQAANGLQKKLLDVTGADDTTPPDEVIRRVYSDLADAPCLALAATLEDVLAVEERPNLPGTVDEWPNWCLALPVPLEEIERAPLAPEIALRLSRGP